MVKSKQKGGAFEREVCTLLSLWMTAGKRDDIFWRTAGSGARATRRGRDSTAGSYGDIMAIDPIGQLLLDRFTFELKKGYNTCSCQDFLDIPNGRTLNKLESFIDSARTDAKVAGSITWCLIHKRDRRDALMYFDMGELPSGPGDDIWWGSILPRSVLRLPNKIQLLVLPFKAFLALDPNTVLHDI